MGQRLYCGNISYECTEDDLKKCFEDAEFPVEEAKVIMDRDTGRARGFGFVTLADGVDANEAIEALHETIFMGRKLVVNEAREKSQTHGGRRGGNDRSRGSHRRDDR